MKTNLTTGDVKMMSDTLAEQHARIHDAMTTLEVADTALTRTVAVALTHTAEMIQTVIEALAEAEQIATAGDALAKDANQPWSAPFKKALASVTPADLADARRRSK